MVKMKSFVRYLLCFTSIGFIFYGCHQQNSNTNYISEATFDSSDLESPIDFVEEKCDLEDSLLAWGLVNVQTIAPSIKVDLRYADTNNFTGVKLYDCLNKAFLQKIPAEQLAIAQKKLKEIDSSFSLLIWDAVRPVHVQQKMWGVLQMPISEKSKFVSNPKNHSVHNYGCAVDLTICDSEGNPIDMCTDFDHFGKESSAVNLWEMVNQGVLTKKQMENRLLLQKVMKAANFTILPSEWWHFNFGNRDLNKTKYRVVP